MDKVRDELLSSARVEHDEGMVKIEAGEMGQSRTVSYRVVRRPALAGLRCSHKVGGACHGQSNR